MCNVFLRFKNMKAKAFFRAFFSVFAILISICVGDETRGIRTICSIPRTPPLRRSLATCVTTVDCG